MAQRAIERGRYGAEKICRCMHAPREFVSGGRPRGCADAGSEEGCLLNQGAAATSAAQGTRSRVRSLWALPLSLSRACMHLPSYRPSPSESFRAILTLQPLNPDPPSSVTLRSKTISLSIILPASVSVSCSAFSSSTPLCPSLPRCHRSIHSPRLRALRCRPTSSPPPFRSIPSDPGVLRAA
eukprot:6174042-Pleurochrysis_carterae.AAC.1